MTVQEKLLPLYCSFCGKSQHEVRKLIVGPAICICDECVILCMNIIIDDSQSVAIPQQTWQGWELPAQDTVRLAAERSLRLGQGQELGLQILGDETLFQLPAGRLIRILCFAAQYGDERRSDAEVSEFARSWKIWGN